VLNVMLEPKRWTARLRAGGALDDAQAFSACMVLPVHAPCRCSIGEQPASTLAVGEFLFCAPSGEHAGISVRCEAASGALAVLVALGRQAAPERPPAPG
jgi:hypothetical protein